MNEKSYEPYPLRPSEYINSLESLPQVQALEISKDEREKLMAFEGTLFRRYKEAIRPSIITHAIYPEAFTTEEGKEIFAEVYQTPRLGEVDAQAIEKVFLETDLSKVTKEQRERAYNFSFQWARSTFISDFRNAAGNVSKIENPKRVLRVVNPENLIAKEQGLHKFKAELKKESSEIDEGAGDFAEAERLILDIYRRRINVSMADLYEYKGVGTRNIERIDHFLNGVGLNFDTKGYFETLPEKLRSYAEQRSREVETETPEYKKYNAIKVNSGIAKKLAEFVLHEYGVNEGDNKWKVVPENGRTTFSVLYKNGDEFKREIYAPKIYNGGLVDTLTVLAHEIEGHVVRYLNKEQGVLETMNLFEKGSSGRGSLLSEGAAMFTEGKTEYSMVGMKGKAGPYFFLATQEKMRGGSFKECFRVIAEAYAKRMFGMTIEEAISDNEKFERVSSYSFQRATRLFRRNTPLSDTSGNVTSSDVLDYIEQELVLDYLMSNAEKTGEISKIIYIAGVDIYNAFDLKKLGLLDLTKVQEPKMVVSNILWPRIKKGIDAGKNINEIIANL